MTETNTEKEREMYIRRSIDRQIPKIRSTEKQLSDREKKMQEDFIKKNGIKKYDLGKM